MGEIAPTYFASRAARERIATVAPRAKIVCIFRNPVERVLSLYRLKCAYGRFRWSFEEALLRDPELMDSSKYATHFRTWRDTFGTENTLATFTTICAMRRKPFWIRSWISSACSALR